MKTLLAHILGRIARSLGLEEIQWRLDQIDHRLAAGAVSDSLYAAIEERFRGDPVTIKERQRMYMPFVAGSTNDFPVLDLGSGRGEWLDLLRENGTPAMGVDSNLEFVESGRKRGLDLAKGDLLEYLRGRPDSTVGAVTMFQVAEHLPLGLLESVIADAHRVLRKNGTLIIEIPNIETLRVGASTFWIDPTHLRPLFPEFLVFLVQRAGFSQVERLTSTPLSEIPEGLSGSELELHQRINGDGDFAVIARK